MPSSESDFERAKDELEIFTGNSNPALAHEVCEHLGVRLGEAEVGRFPDGEVMVEVRENVRGGDCFVLQSICTPPNENLMELLLLMDALRRASAKRLYFTPTGASWLNLVERWFAGLTEKQLRRGVHRSTRELQDAIRHYLELNNRHPKPFIWTKTADQILESVARFCKRTSDSGH